MINPKLKHRGPTGIEAGSVEMESQEKTIGMANNIATSKLNGQSKPAVQRKQTKSSESTSPEDLELQRKEKGSGGTEVSARFQSAIESTKSSGENLNNGVRSSFGAKFGTDFGNVKIHNNSRAHQLAEEVNAKAFTVGNDIYFGKGEYRPNTKEGKHLLAHELTHTQQQSGKLQRQVDKQEWYEPAMEFSYYMPYNIMSIIHLTDEKKAYAIPKDEMSSFEEWRKILRREKRKWFSKMSIGSDDDKIKAKEMNNSLGLLARSVKSGVIPKRHLVFLKKSIKSISFKSANEWDGGREQTCPRLTSSELVEIFLGGDLKAQIASKGAISDFYTTEFNRRFKNVDDYKKNYIEGSNGILKKLNDAFEIMKIDTDKAKAVYLAHAGGETSNFLGLTEQNSKHTPGYKDYEGRGAFHTTFKKNYIRTISYMESLIASKNLKPKDELIVKKALVAIKKDPKQAANPEYTFIFSAAYMHSAGGVKLSGDIKDSVTFLGKDAASSWVAGQDVTEIDAEIVEGTNKTGFELRADLKAKVYRKALEVLRRKKCNEVSDVADYGYGYDNMDWDAEFHGDAVRPGPMRRTLIKKRN